MCWVISTGARSMHGADAARCTALSACGPPVDDADQQHARRRRRERPQHDLPARCARCEAGALGTMLRLAARPARRCAASSRRDARPRRTDGAIRVPAGAARREPSARILSISSRRNVGEPVSSRLALRLRDVVGGAERERAQADLGVPAGQRRRHEHDEIALLLQQPRQRGDAVDLRHIDVEHDDVRDRRARPARSPRARCAARRRLRRSGSASTQRAIRPRTTTASSTTITRMASAARGRCQSWGGDGDAHRGRATLDGRTLRARRRRAPSDQPDFLELGLDDLLVERLHDVLVGAGMQRARDVRDIVLGGAEHHLRPVARPAAGAAPAGTRSRPSSACSSRAGSRPASARGRRRAPARRPRLRGSGTRALREFAAPPFG